MLMEFFLENARIELAADATRYRGFVPDLPEIYVEAATPEQCRAKLADAITEALARESHSPAQSDSRKQTQSGSIAASRAAQPRALKEGEILPSLEFTDILYEKRDGIARVIINRPEVYNAYSSATLREMTRAFEDAARDDEVAVLVLTGAGDRAFCAGSDVKQHSEQHLGNPREAWKWMGVLIEAHDALRHLGKPSIARINGIVAGGGNEWNLACDLAIAADHAKFLHVETSVGMVAAGGAAYWLPLVIGERRAREMLLTCEPVAASKALEWGMVNDVVPFTELDDAVAALCRKLIDKFPECARYTRQQLSFWKDIAWNATIQHTREWLALHFAGPEAREGLGALNEQRAVDYRGYRKEANQRASGESRSNERSRIEEDFLSERACRFCGSRGLSALFEYCGTCGARIKTEPSL